METPTDLDRLCNDLGISQKRRARLAHDKGDELLPWLQKTWRWSQRQAQGQYLHAHATASTPDYVDTPEKAMRGEHGPEWAPPANEIGAYRDSLQAKDRFRAEQLERVGDLLGACEEVRAAVAGLDPKTKKGIGREIWLLRSKIDGLERKLKRQMAA